jgi:hypothetical protein
MSGLAHRGDIQFADFTANTFTLATKAAFKPLSLFAQTSSQADVISQAIARRRCGCEHGRQVIARKSIFRCLAIAFIAFPMGCEGPATIPPTGTLEMSGVGNLNYIAESAGDVYILDTHESRKVFAGHMNKGDQILLNPSQDQVMLAGTSAKHAIALKTDHNYQIYFTAAE